MNKSFDDSDVTNVWLSLLTRLATSTSLATVQVHQRDDESFSFDELLLSGFSGS